jgi:lysophospholipase L1-like esterase
MGVVFTDDFTGNAAPWSTSKWANYLESESPCDNELVSDKGHLIAAGGGYRQCQIFAKDLTVTDFEATFTLRGLTGDEAYYNFVFRCGDTSALGSQGPRSAYGFEMYTNSPNTAAVLVRRNSSGGNTVLASGTATGGFVDVNRNFRVRVEGSDIKIRVWPVGDSEPSTWLIEHTDSTYSSGALGFSLFNGSAGTAQTLVVDDLVVDDLAPPDPTGTGSPTLARHVVAGSGTSAPPAGVGTGALDLARHAVAGSGSTVAPPAADFPEVFSAFTGTNGDAWPAPWTTSLVTGSTGGAVNIQSNRGRLRPHTDTGYTTARAVATGVTVTDARMTGVFRVNNTSEQFPVIGLRGGDWSGSVPARPATAFILYPGISEGVLAVEMFIDNSKTTIATMSFSWSTDTDYGFTFETIEQGSLTLVRAKVWSGNEPTTWTLSGTTSASGRPASGLATIGYLTNNTTSHFEVDNVMLQELDDGRTRLLAVGDSFTQGPYNFPGGVSSTWRRYVWEYFEDTAEKLQMVGSFSRHWDTNAFAGLGTWDYDHYARNSWEIGDALSGVAGEVEVYQPDIVVVALGLNDVLNTSDTITEIVDNLEAVVTAARAERADAGFVICTMPPYTSPTPRLNLVDLNAAIVARANTLSTLTSPVVTADWYTGFDSAWLYDGLHVNDAGDQFLADAVIAAIGQLDGPSGDGALSLARHSVAGSGTATLAEVSGTGEAALVRHSVSGSGFTGSGRLFVGSVRVDDVFVGASQVDAVYVGSSQVWP